MDMNKSLVIMGEGVEGVRGLNGNGKNAIKMWEKREQEV